MCCMNCGGGAVWCGPGDGAVETGTGARRGLRGAVMNGPGGPPGAGGQNCGVLTSGTEGTA